MTAMDLMTSAAFLPHQTMQPPVSALVATVTDSAGHVLGLLLDR